jgi:hypothetical protein
MRQLVLLFILLTGASGQTSAPTVTDVRTAYSFPGTYPVNPKSGLPITSPFLRSTSKDNPSGALR